MTAAAARIWAGVRWFAQVQVWTTAVTLALVATLAVQLAAIPFGGASIALSPRGTVEAFYQSAQDGDYERALSLLDEPGRREATAMGADAWREMLDEITQGRTMTEIVYGSQRNFGRNVVIGVLLEYEDRTLRGVTEELVRENRHWRMMWPPASRKFKETMRIYDPWYGY